LGKLTVHDIANAHLGVGTKRKLRENIKEYSNENVWEWFVCARARSFPMSGTVVLEYTDVWEWFVRARARSFPISGTVVLECTK
jgi:hypothetical protein